MSSLKSTERINDKDIKKLEKQYAKGKVCIAGIIKEQESVVIYVRQMFQTDSLR